MRYVILIISILAVMYLIIFLSARKRKILAAKEMESAQKNRLNYQRHIKSTQTTVARKQNYVTKYNATIDYQEKDPSQKQLPPE